MSMWQDKDSDASDCEIAIMYWERNTEDQQLK